MKKQHSGYTGKGGSLRSRPALLWILLILLLLTSALFSLFCGRYGLAPSSVIQAVFMGSESTDMELNIVRSIRMPRILLVMLVGGGLAISGAAFQGIFQNPLVSPDVLSVSSGSAFGAVLGIMLGWGNGVISAMALLFGVISVILTYIFAREKGEVSTLSLVLSGMIMSALFNALISLMKYVADTDTQLPAITYWLLGSFSSTTYKQVRLVLFPILFGSAVLVAMSNRINILSLGDEEAYALGINPVGSRAIVILGATLVTSACITVTGIIGWVGLVIPHISRFLFGPNHTRLIPASALIGAIFMTLVDLLARTATATEIPVGILTALIGAPFFAIMFRRRRNGA